MKQFNKYGVAAAVAAVCASSSFAQLAAGPAPTLTGNATGDAAIIPYYTVNGDWRTGVHIINTTMNTQVVKFRMRRGSDSRDALDFNLILSPHDEWTASIAAEGDDIVVNTNDKSCTAPLISTGRFVMPPATANTINARVGAEEGYIEVIGMGQSINETQHIATGALHVDGVPADCATVEKNFFRLPRTGQASQTAIADSATTASIETAVNANGDSYNGVHNSAVTSDGTNATATSFNRFTDTDDNAFKVSFFIRNEVTGTEFGGNAVHMVGFADEPMMTNQQLLGFSNGVFQFDPYNFELPNLSQGSYANGEGRLANHSGEGKDFLFEGVRNALAAAAVINDYSNRPTGDFVVATDWTVTLPGQYAMADGICVLYADFTGTACSGSGTVLSNDDLPVDLSTIDYWDREEGTESIQEGGLSVSPGGSGTFGATLGNEVNVINWGGGDSVLMSSDYKYDFELADGFENGWARIGVTSDNGTADALAFLVGVDAAGTSLNLMSGQAIARATGTAPATQAAYGAYVSASGGVPIIGGAFWQKLDANNPGASYGRYVEHSYQQ